MRTMTITLACLVAATATATAAHARDAKVEAPITTFAAAFNKGDIPTAAAQMADSIAITDEFAPFHWVGKDAFATWMANFDTDAKAKGLTDPAVTIGAPTRELVAGDDAYVIVPATYRFTLKGVKMVEVAQMTFQLSKKSGSYKIAAWTWTGPNPSRAK